MIGIINYGLGNIRSVCSAVEKIGSEYKLISESKDLNSVSKIILPGVGAFSKGINNLENSGMADAIKYDVLTNSKPILGICLGMQLLATQSEEHGTNSGLGLIKGNVIKIDSCNNKLAIPHVGWNQIKIKNKDKIFESIPDNTDFYFVHSYYFSSESDEVVIGSTDYGISLAAVINKDNIYGIQAHPEKSQLYGIRFLENFIKRVD